MPRSSSRRTSQVQLFFWRCVWRPDVARILRCSTCANGAQIVRVWALEECDALLRCSVAMLACLCVGRAYATWLHIVLAVLMYLFSLYCTLLQPVGRTAGFSQSSRQAMRVPGRRLRASFTAMPRTRVIAFLSFFALRPAVHKAVLARCHHVLARKHSARDSEKR